MRVSRAGGFPAEARREGKGRSAPALARRGRGLTSSQVPGPRKCGCCRFRGAAHGPRGDARARPPRPRGQHGLPIPRNTGPPSRSTTRRPCPSPGTGPSRRLSSRFPARLFRAGASSRWNVPNPCDNSLTVQGDLSMSDRRQALIGPAISEGDIPKCRRAAASGRGRRGLRRSDSAQFTCALPRFREMSRRSGGRARARPEDRWCRASLTRHLRARHARASGGSPRESDPDLSRHRVSAASGPAASPTPPCVRARTPAASCTPRRPGSGCRRVPAPARTSTIRWDNRDSRRRTP